MKNTTSQIYYIFLLGEREKLLMTNFPPSEVVHPMMSFIGRLPQHMEHFIYGYDYYFFCLKSGFPCGYRTIFVHPDTVESLKDVFIDPNGVYIFWLYNVLCEKGIVKSEKSITFALWKQTQKLFTLGLGLTEPWEVKETKLVVSETDAKYKELHIWIDFNRDHLFVSSKSQLLKAHDSVDKTWRHLNFFEHPCYLHANVPRLRTTCATIEMVSVPWQDQARGSHCCSRLSHWRL